MGDDIKRRFVQYVPEYFADREYWMWSDHSDNFSLPFLFFQQFNQGKSFDGNWPATRFRNNLAVLRHSIGGTGITKIVIRTPKGKVPEVPKFLDNLTFVEGKGDWLMELYIEELTADRIVLNNRVHLVRP